MLFSRSEFTTYDYVREIVLQKLDFSQDKLDYVSQVFYYHCAVGIMWLLGDALCSAHYFPNPVVSMSSLTVLYDLLYTGIP